MKGRLVNNAIDGQFEPLLEIIKEGRNIILDLSGTTAIDTAGIGSIISLAQEVRKQGTRLSLLNANEQVRNYFNIVRVDFLKFHRTIKEAEKYMQGQ